LISPGAPDTGTVSTGYAYNLDRQLTAIDRPDAVSVAMEYGSSSGRLERIVTPEGDYSYSVAGGLNPEVQFLRPEAGQVS
jgi:YD repeat-containing protein